MWNATEGLVDEIKENFQKVRKKYNDIKTWEEKNEIWRIQEVYYLTDKSFRKWATEKRW